MSKSEINMWLVGFYYPKRMNKLTEHYHWWILNTDITDFESINLAMFHDHKKNYNQICPKILINVHSYIPGNYKCDIRVLIKMNYYYK